MKERNVHRGVTSMPADKQSSPVGKLSRIHRTYPKTDRKHKSRGRSKSQARFRKYLNYFFAVFGLVFLATICWMLYAQIKRKEIVRDTSTLAEETFAVPHPKPATCEKMIQSLYAATTPSEWEPLVYLRSMDKELFAQEFSSYKKLTGDIKKVEWTGVQETNGLSLESALLTYRSGNTQSVYLIHDKEGVWRVDGESLIQHQTKTWDELGIKGSCTARLRVIIALDYYFNGVFVDEAEWVNVSLSTLDRQHKIYGYVRTKTSTSRAVRELLKSDSATPVIVEVSRNSSMSPMQFEVKKIIAQGWVESDNEFSAKFHDDVKATTEVEEAAPVEP